MKSIEIQCGYRVNAPVGDDDCVEIELPNYVMELSSIYFTAKDLVNMLGLIAPHERQPPIHEQAESYAESRLRGIDADAYVRRKVHAAFCSGYIRGASDKLFGTQAEES